MQSLTAFDLADAKSTPRSSLKIYASHFRNIIYGANTRKIFGSDEQIANREQSIGSKRYTNFLHGLFIIVNTILQN